MFSKFLSKSTSVMKLIVALTLCLLFVSLICSKALFPGNEMVVVYFDSLARFAGIVAGVSAYALIVLILIQFVALNEL